MVEDRDFVRRRCRSRDIRLNKLNRETQRSVCFMQLRANCRVHRVEDEVVIDAQTRRYLLPQAPDNARTWWRHVLAKVEERRLNTYQAAKNLIRREFLCCEQAAPNRVVLIKIAIMVTRTNNNDSITRGNNVFQQASRMTILGLPTGVGNIPTHHDDASLTRVCAIAFFKGVSNSLRPRKDWVPAWVFDEMDVAKMYEKRRLHRGAEGYTTASGSGRGEPWQIGVDWTTGHTRKRRLFVRQSSFTPCGCFTSDFLGPCELG